MWILLGTVFVSSLLGSLHCVGMCGPFAMIAAADSNKGSAPVVPTLAYSCGRLVTYSIVGLIFGALGLVLNQGVAFANWQQTATYVAGGLMILVGIISLARYLGFRIALPGLFSPVQKFLQVGFAKARTMTPVWRAFSIGALTSLMPCGWLYTFAISAAGTGSPLWGMALMVTFWAGTVPIMAALVLGVDKIGTPIQKKLPVAMACLVIAIGVFTVAYRAPVAIGAETAVATGTEDLISQIKNVDHTSMPCCRKPSHSGTEDR